MTVRLRAVSCDERKGRTVVTGKGRTDGTVGKGRCTEGQCGCCVCVSVDTVTCTNSSDIPGDYSTILL